MSETTTGQRLSERTQARVTEVLPYLSAASVNVGDVLRGVEARRTRCVHLPAWPERGPETPDEAVNFRRQLLTLQLALMEATCGCLSPGESKVFHAAEYATVVLRAAVAYINGQCDLGRVDTEARALAAYRDHVLTTLR